MKQNHQILKMYFDRKKKGTTGFSVRTLATRLGVSASFLSRVLNGQKPVPAHLLPKLAKALDIEPELLSPAHKKSSKNNDALAAEDWILTEVDSMRILRNWYYIPILELTTLENCNGTPESIALRLGLSKTTAEVALQELLSLGLLRFAKGRYWKTDAKIRLVSSKSTPLIRRFHEDLLEKAQDELRQHTEDQDFERRLVTGITVSADPEVVRVAKQKLANFLHELANELTEHPGTEVYHLSAQLFPLTRSK